MAIQLSKKQSDLEKRLKILHNQVYGSQNLSTKKGVITAASLGSDTVFLKSDLLKIALLSCFAIGSQLVLYYLTQKHILNLNFF